MYRPDYDVEPVQLNRALNIASLVLFIASLVLLALIWQANEQANSLETETEIVKEIN